VKLIRTAVARRTIRWAAIGLNVAATCYYGLAVARFLFAPDYPFADKVGFMLSFKGLVFLAGVFAPALAVVALLDDRPTLSHQSRTDPLPTKL
jgi:hypothetical protein